MVYRAGNKRGRRVTRITLGGVDIRNVTYADVRRGVVRSIVRTGDGQAMLNPADPRQLLRIERRGRVRVYVGKQEAGYT